MRSYDHGGDIYDSAHVEIDFSVNTNPLGMPNRVRAAIIDCIDDCVRYPDPHCRALRTALSKHHRIDREHILCGNGAADLILRICAALTPKNVLAFAPTFSEYARCVALFGGKVQWYPLKESDQFLPQDDLLDKLTPDIDMLFLCNPNNPTGQLMSHKLLHALCEKCAQNDILFVLDECFIEFTDGQSMISQLEKYPHLLILRAYTKIYAMAGLRLGYLLCADTELLSRISIYGAEWSVSLVAQETGIAALSAVGWVTQTRTFITDEKIYLTKALSEQGIKVFPSDANFLLLKSSVPLYERLKNKGILVRNCSNFKGLDEFFIRIGIQTHDKNKRLVCAIAEVLLEWQKI